MIGRPKLSVKVVAPASGGCEREGSVPAITVIVVGLRDAVSRMIVRGVDGEIVVGVAAGGAEAGVNVVEVVVARVVGAGLVY